MINTLSQYIRRQAAKLPSLTMIKDTLDDPKAQIGLILAERMINIPAQVVAPMYKMLLEEMTWAIEEKEPYTFTHYLILSRTYEEVASVLDEETRPKKKTKGAGSADKKETFYFHPEDEVSHRSAMAHGGYSYEKESADGTSDSKRAFQELGIKPQGHMILLEASKFEATVEALEEYLTSA